MSSGSLNGGSIRILWDASTPATVNITGGSVAWTVNGSGVTFPYTLSASTTFDTGNAGSYTVSVLHQGYEVANTPDGTKAVSLRFGEQVVFAPTVDATPDNNFVASLSATYASARQVRPVANETHVPTRNGSPNNLSDGVSTGITTQTVHACQTAAAGLQLAYANYYNNNGVDADGLNNITVKASLKLSDATFMPVFFNGRRSVVIEPGATVVSDPIPASYLKGNTIISRTFVSVAGGEKYPLGITTDASLGSGVVSGDSVDSGAIGASATKGYAPWAVLGTPRYANGVSPRVLLVGDSRVAGYGDTSGNKDAYGWARRAFDGQLAYLNVAVSGSTVSGAQTLQGLRRRLALADACGTFTDVIVCYGVNDLTGGSTSAQVQTRLQACYDIFKDRGLRVWGATIAPVTTSSDTWATVGNQTPVASNANRITVNNWIRTTPTPLAGFFEFADAVESARDSGLWKATGSASGYTLDGTHESIGGYTAEAAVINLATLGTVLTA